MDKRSPCLLSASVNVMSAGSVLIAILLVVALVSNKPLSASAIEIEPKEYEFSRYTSQSQRLTDYLFEGKERHSMWV